MKVAVRLFAKARDAAGTNKCNLEFGADEDGNVADASLQAALKMLIALHPKLATVLPTCSLALNEEFVVPATVSTTTLKAGDVLAILPPVSGG